MAPQMISPGFVEDALECLHRQTHPGRAGAAGGRTPRCGARNPFTPQQYGRLWLAIASRNRRRILRACGSTDAARQLHVAVSRRAGMPARWRRRYGARCSFCAWYSTSRAASFVVADGQGADRPSRKAGTPYSAFAYRTFWLILLGVACWLIGRRISAATHRFCMPEPGPAAATTINFFGVPVHFDRPDSQACVQLAAYLSLPTNPLRTIAEDISARRNRGTCWSVTGHDSGWVAKTRAHLKALPAAEWPDFDTLAVRLGTTPADAASALAQRGSEFCGDQGRVAQCAGTGAAART
ncbi:AraC family transcriptional regulator ligand-binding domain-containing protein [Burkholderia vietnamiensis]|uniref:AraC family transcriptional regulator ligand-binding domain-containing protein n=1 Tax=Burkholderia vietnamiensis TaxID=60552 RepID=UPI001F5ED3B3|nr:AraC family transcriptional regulator ligand-binding domain-containing protein [Burkholderia vietnamiensis]